MILTLCRYGKNFKRYLRSNLSINFDVGFNSRELISYQLFILPVEGFSSMKK